MTKTTFILADSRRDHLKRIAIARKTTVTELLAEGADLVIAKYERAQDREDLERRGREAAERMRGFYVGPSASDRVDEILYRAPSRKSQRRRK